MDKLNFFYVVGAAKSGTTSIYHYLDKHPDVYMSPIKEPHYFCKDIRCENFNKAYRRKVYFDMQKYFENKTLEKKHIAFIESFEKYSQLFRELENEKIAGEISNGYLYSKVAAKEICRFNADAKIVIVLRNPIERAFSHWLMTLRGGENVWRNSFLDAIEEDQKKEQKGWGKSHLYIEIGLYYKQVKRYFNAFPREQILVLLYDDLCADSFGFFKQIFDFLEVMPMSIVADSSKRYNSSSVPKYPVISGAIYKLKLNKLAAKYLPKGIKYKIKNTLLNNKNLPKLTSNERTSLQYCFDDDIGLLEKLIDRDLSTWRSS